MIMLIHPIDPFTPAAARRWKKIPKWAQEKISANVWCGNCLGSVHIVLETADMREKDLILKGNVKPAGRMFAGSSSRKTNNNVRIGSRVVISARFEITV